MPGLGSKYSAEDTAEKTYYEVRKYRSNNGHRSKEYYVVATESAPYHAYLAAFNVIKEGIDSDYHDTTLDVVKVVPYDAAVYKVGINTILDLHKQHSEEVEPTVEIEIPNGL